MAAIRAAQLQVSISSNRRHWEVIHSAYHLFDDVAAPGPLIIRLLETRGARFVKLELPQGGVLALNQVEIMVARRHKALWRVARRYGLAFERMTSLRMRRHVKPFSVQNIPRKFDGRVEAFYVNATQGRFGNHVHQIGSAVCLAQHLGVPRVYLGTLPMLEIDRPIRFGDVTVLPDSELRRDRPKGVLCGTFYYRKTLGHAFEDMSYRDVVAAARAVGQPIFRHLAPDSAFKPEATDLVVHFRAGDLFARPDPHTNYAQPPLAFYRLCVDFARAQLGVRRIVLVYEDDGNPCVAGLKAWLDEIGVQHVSHARTLEEDLAVLLAASHCVFGRGTFGLAVAILSGNLRTLFYSWLEPNFGTMAEVSGFRPVKVLDAARGYIRRGDWRNTPEQRQMMLDYPIGNLRLTAD
jgi:hypothetical protein